MLTPERQIRLGMERPVNVGRRAGCLPQCSALCLAHLLKRCLDVIGASALIVLLLPMFVVTGLLVYLDDGLPIIYRRRVVGMPDEFDAFKFRTMKRNADALLAADPVLRADFERNFKLVNDPRVTRIGALLRGSSLDELPQLLNVLRGQMSLVGPRMITAPELAKYGSHRALLLSAKPGLTGYWQVMGRQKVDYDERVRMDVHYLENWNLKWDMAILLRTPLKVIKREGAL